MPGRLAMDQQAIANDSLESKRDRAHVRPPDQQNPSVEQKDLQMNGVQPATIVSPSSDQVHNTLTNGDVKHVAPALDRSWRDTPANKPLGKLLDRMAQMCYTDMQELVSKISEEGGANDAHPEVNGGGLITTDDKNPASVKKKRLLLDFASTWRERFVKALVISDWSRTSGEDVAKIIDLRATLMARVVHVEQAIQAIGDLKRDTVGARMPALNIKGAMQYLSTGKSLYPALDHLKPAPLTARQILDLLDQMGTIANLRICLEEPNLPRHMFEYDIANGRVTFKTPGEFQVDLACLDQDPEKSPWYFIDFRFDFSPAPGQISEQVRMHFETAINNATTTSGLQGCYDFCHAFVLDQKLVEVESQAYKLMRERWSHSIMVQRSRRLVTVQYWTKRKSARPSWVEFGIYSGKENNTGSTNTPSVGLRWFKDAELMKDVNVDMDWTSINLEAFLFNVIRQHSMALLKQMHAIVEQKQMTKDMIALQLKTPEDDPYGICLAADLTKAHPACTDSVTCSISPYAGSWSIRPCSRQAQDLEAMFDKESDVIRIALQLEHFICATMQEGIHFEAQLQQWTTINDILPLSSKEQKALFGTAAVITLWAPSSSWSSSTVLACATSLTSQAWYTVELKSSTAGRQIAAATDLPLPSFEWSGLLKRVQSKAVEQVQYKQMKTEAQLHNIPFHTEHFRRRLWLTSNSTAESAAYFFKFGDLMTNYPTISSRPWAYEPVRASPGTLLTSIDGRTLVRHEIRLTMKSDRLKALKRHLHTHKAADIGISNDGGVSILVSIPLGTSFLQAMQTSISSICRLDDSIAISQRLSMRITNVSIRSLAFSYGAQNDYAMRLTYSQNGTLPVHLKVEPAEMNPHQRIRTSLEQLLNRDKPDSFHTFVHILVLTLPLLQAIERLESTCTPGRTFTLHVRHATWYSIKYRGTNTITFNIRARTRLEGNQRVVRWHIEQERQRPGGARPLPDALTKSLADFWSTPSIDGVIGLRTSLVVGATGVASAVEKLHSIVSPFVQLESSAQAAASDEASAKPPTTPTAAAPAPAPPATKEQEDKQDVIMLD